MKELIQLTEASLAQSEQSQSSASKKKQIAGNDRVVAFAAGDEVLAKYSGDSNYYPARVTSVGGSAEKRVYSVVFKGYNNTELLDGNSIKTLPPNYSRDPKASTLKRKLTKEEEEERDRKKKKNEKKAGDRAAKAKEQNQKQASWQKFTKKAERKGVVIAGVAGTSIFKTPDNPLGKGVCSVPLASASSLIARRGRRWVSPGRARG